MTRYWAIHPSELEVGQVFTELGMNEAQMADDRWWWVLDGKNTDEHTYWFHTLIEGYDYGPQTYYPDDLVVVRVET